MKVPIPTPPHIPTPPPAPELDAQTSKHICKPSQQVLDIIEGCASLLNRPSDPTIACGIQLLTPLPPVAEQPQTRVFEGEGQSKWLMAANFPDEYAMLAEISDKEAYEPQTLTEAKCRPNWLLWERTIKEALDTLWKAGTWELTEVPPGANIISSKWVFHAKKGTARNVIHYKAWLIAQDFLQLPGADYFDTFAPVAKLASIRAVLAIAVADDLEMHQIDIKGAYSNRVLTDQEVIYMQQSPGYHTASNDWLICCLQKMLYGLEQSGCCWYQKLMEIMMTHLGFSRSDIDHAVYLCCEGKSIIIVLVHMDDCTITASSIRLINNFKVSISKHVEITDLGKLPGIEVKRDRVHNSLHLSQCSSIDSILCWYGLQDLKSVSIPMDTSIWLTTAQSPSTTADFALMHDIPYRVAVGLLMYAVLRMRPDIAFAIHCLTFLNKTWLCSLGGCQTYLPLLKWN